MHYKLFTALPNFLSDNAKTLLFETDLSEETGRLSWPRIVMYEFTNEWGEIIRSQLPPKNEDRYYYRVLNLEAYEYLCKTGWMYDPRHTGRNTIMIDNRRAPGA